MDIYIERERGGPKGRKLKKNEEAMIWQESRKERQYFSLNYSQIVIREKKCEEKNNRMLLLW